MARKPFRGKRKFNLRRVRATPALSLGALAAITVIKADLVGAADQAYRLSSMRGIWSVVGLTAAEGPVTIGVAFSDYSVTEIKECLEAALSISQGNKIAQEQANRLVRVVGEVTASEPVINESRPFRTRLNWAIPIGSRPQIFAYNNDSGAPLTTGAILNWSGDLWVKDSS